MVEAKYAILVSQYNAETLGQLRGGSNHRESSPNFDRQPVNDSECDVNITRAVDRADAVHCDPS